MAVAVWSGPEIVEDKEVRRTTRTTILGSEDGSVVRALYSSSKGRGFESGQERWDKKKSPASTFCAESYFCIRYTPALPQLHVKDPATCTFWRNDQARPLRKKVPGPVISPKRASGRLQLNTYASYVCGIA